MTVRNLFLVTYAANTNVLYRDGKTLLDLLPLSELPSHRQNFVRTAQVTIVVGA